MEYRNLVQDFARRTRRNLDTLRRLQAERPDLEIYEVTQLINSLLGLLVFPQQGYYTHIPETPLADLATQGWPIPKVVGDFPQAKDLRQLMRYLRNAVGHFNIKFTLDEQHQINGLQVWNIDPKTRNKTWEATISLEELEQLVERFVALILDEDQPYQGRPA